MTLVPSPQGHSTINLVSLSLSLSISLGACIRIALHSMVGWSGTRPVFGIEENHTKTLQK